MTRTWREPSRAVQWSQAWKGSFESFEKSIYWILRSSCWSFPSSSRDFNVYVRVSKVISPKFAWHLHETHQARGNSTHFDIIVLEIIQEPPAASSMVTCYRIQEPFCTHHEQSFMELSLIDYFQKLSQRLHLIFEANICIFIYISEVFREDCIFCRKIRVQLIPKLETLVKLNSEQDLGGQDCT